MNQLKLLLLERPLSAHVIRQINQELSALLNESGEDLWFYAICLSCFRDLISFPPRDEGDVADDALDELAVVVKAGLEAIELNQTAKMIATANSAVRLTRNLLLLS